MRCEKLPWTCWTKFTPDSHFCKIKRRCSFLSNFAQSVPENRTIPACADREATTAVPRAAVPCGVQWRCGPMATSPVGASSREARLNSPGAGSPRRLLAKVADDRHPSPPPSLGVDSPRSPRSSRQAARLQLSQTDSLVVLGLAETEDAAMAILEKERERESRRLKALKAQADRERTNLLELQRATAQKEARIAESMQGKTQEALRQRAERQERIQEKQTERFNRSQTILLTRDEELEKRAEEHTKKWEKENHRLAREKMRRETWRKDRIKAREQKQSARIAKVEESRAHHRSEMLESVQRKEERERRALDAKRRAEESRRSVRMEETEARLSMMQTTRQLAIANREETRLSKAAALAAEQERDAQALQEHLRQKEREAVIAAEMEKILPDREPKFGARVIGGAWVPSPPVSNKPTPQMLAAQQKLQEAQQKKELDRTARLERRRAVLALEEERRRKARQRVRGLLCSARSHCRLAGPPTPVIMADPIVGHAIRLPAPTRLLPSGHARKHRSRRCARCVLSNLKQRRAESSRRLCSS